MWCNCEIAEGTVYLRQVDSPAGRAPYHLNCILNEYLIGLGDLTSSQVLKNSRFPLQIYTFRFTNCHIIRLNFTVGNYTSSLAQYRQRGLCCYGSSIYISYCNSCSTSRLNPSHRRRYCLTWLTIIYCIAVKVLLQLRS